VNIAGGLRLWLRWSQRDLRRRWLTLTITALVIALGTGLFAGLSSVSRWRQMSNDASFEATRYHDLRVRLPADSFLPEGTLRAAALAVEGLPLAAAEERIVLPTQVDVTTEDDRIIVPGRLIGAPTGAAEVDRLHIAEGRPLTASDEGKATVLIERNFAKHYGLPEAGGLRLAGGRAFAFVGHAISPEYILVVTEENALLAEANFAVVFTSLATAQAEAGREGQVNELVVRLAPGADRRAAAALLGERLAALGATVLPRESEDSYRLLVEDAKGDQQFYNVFAIAIFAGAIFAAFNITSRMVEAQRREFGIAMALGVSPIQIALRPLLVGAQIAFLGVAFGVGIGLLVSWAMGMVLRNFLVMPVVETPFQPGLFAAVAAGGFVAPMLAIAYPVWRAVRVAPVRAIRMGHLAVRGPAAARFAGKLPLPGDTFFRLPLRNVVRAPRRTILTALGIAAIIAVLAGLLGYLDAFYDALDRAEEETAQAHPDRLEVDLDRFYGIDSPEGRELLASSALLQAEPRIRTAATLLSQRESVDVFLELVPFDSSLWRPSVRRGSLDRPGLVIAEKAAADLGAGVGDQLTVRHAVRLGDGSYTLAETTFEVVAIHAHPLRVYAYLPGGAAGVFGLEGLFNRISALPATTPGDAREDLFEVPGVVAVQEAAAAPRLLRERFNEFIGIFQVVQGALLFLAALIAFNTASINYDERSREQATMLAFGVRVRTILRMSVVEGLILGAISTLAGLAGGYFLARWFIDVLADQVMPDIGLNVLIRPGSLAIVLVLGIVAVGVTPLFGWRRLRRMNVPSTLRLME
jgi:putative ABC transport system permease protein